MGARWLTCAFPHPPMKIPCRLLPAICLVLSAAACSDDDGGTGPEPRDRIELNKTTAIIYPGSTDSLRATVLSGAGTPVNTRVTWTSSDTLLVKVDSAGVVYGITPGRVFVTATAGALADTVDVTVNNDVAAPLVVSASASRTEVNLAGSDTTITFTINAQDTQSGVGSLRVDLYGPRPVPLSSFTCSDTLPRTGTRNDGTWSCTFPFNRYLQPGQWRADLTLTDRSDRVSRRTFNVQVSGSLQDVTAPQVAGITFAQDAVDVRGGDATVFLRVRARDAEAGVAGMQIVFNAGRYTCSSQALLQHSATQDGTRRDVDLPCQLVVPQGYGGSEANIDHITLYDLRGNQRTVTEAELRAAGFTTRIKVTR
jgi:hypothetical protein